MRICAVAALAAVPVLALVGARAWTAPEPSLVPVSWELDIQADRPTYVSVEVPGHAEARGYWYVLYTLTNRSSEDQLFVPDFLLYTDTGQMLRAGSGISSVVYDAIKRRHNDPLLRDMTSMTGMLRRGEDNARRGVAIWPDFDPAAGKFDVFVGGLSGETSEVTLPTPITVPEKDATGKEQQVSTTTVVLCKTLRLSFALSGEASQRSRMIVQKKGDGWVMR